jgi:hypothetical protein
VGNGRMSSSSRPVLVRHGWRGGGCGAAWLCGQALNGGASGDGGAGVGAVGDEARQCRGSSPSKACSTSTSELFGHRSVGVAISQLYRLLVENSVSPGIDAQIAEFVHSFTFTVPLYLLLYSLRLEI